MTRTRGRAGRIINQRLQQQRTRGATEPAACPLFDPGILEAWVGALQQHLSRQDFVALAQSCRGGWRLAAAAHDRVTYMLPPLLACTGRPFSEGVHRLARFMDVLSAHGGSGKLALHVVLEGRCSNPVPLRALLRQLPPAPEALSAHPELRDLHGVEGELCELGEGGWPGPDGGAFRNLRSLALGCCDGSWLRVDLAQLSRLTYLCIWDTAKSAARTKVDGDAIPASLRLSPTLRHLHLRLPYVTSLASMLDGLPNLRCAELDCARLEALPASSTTLAAVTRLALPWSGLRELPDACLGGALEELVVMNAWRLQRVSDQLWRRCGGALRKLVLDCRQLGSLPAFGAHWPTALRSLHLVEPPPEWLPANLLPARLPALSHLRLVCTDGAYRDGHLLPVTALASLTSLALHGPTPAPLPHLDIGPLTRLRACVVRGGVAQLRITAPLPALCTLELQGGQLIRSTASHHLPSLQDLTLTDGLFAPQPPQQLTRIVIGGAAFVRAPPEEEAPAET